MTYALGIKVLSGPKSISSLGPVRLRELPDHCHIETVPKGGEPFKAHGLQGRYSSWRSPDMMCTGLGWRIVVGAEIGAAVA